MDLQKLFDTLKELGFVEKKSSENTNYIILKQGPLSIRYTKEREEYIDFNFYTTTFAIYKLEDLNYSKLMSELSKFFDNQDFNGMKNHLIREEKIDTIIK